MSGHFFRSSSHLIIRRGCGNSTTLFFLSSFVNAPTPLSSAGSRLKRMLCTWKGNTSPHLLPRSKIRWIHNNYITGGGTQLLYFRFSTTGQVCIATVLFITTCDISPFKKHKTSYNVFNILHSKYYLSTLLTCICLFAIAFSLYLLY